MSESRGIKDNGTKMPKPKKKSRIPKTLLLILLSFIAVALAVILTGYVVLNVFIDRTLDYISYDESDSEWSGVDIDASDYDNEDMGIDFSNFSDPEEIEESLPEIDESEPEPDISHGNIDDENDESSKSGGSSYVPAPPEPPYEPDYEIIEGLFDGDTVTDVYDKDVINILLLGADTLSGKHARSDTMILMSVNNVKKRIVFTSFMRDIYVEIPGYKNNRLNASFAAGGPALLIKTIKKKFDIDIDFYMMVSISSFEQAVDVIGGIDLTVNETNYNYFKTWEGIAGLSEAEATNGSHTVHLTGGKALGYARSRNYSNGDFTRTLHQRDLLMQMAMNCKNKSLTQLHDLIKAVLPYVSTNIPKATLKSMVWNVLTYVSYNITDARCPCPGSFEYARIDGREVLVVNKEANEKYIKAKIYG